MDENQKQLLEKTKKLLTESRYLTAQEVFIIEASLNDPNISDEDLQTIYESLTEYKNEQDAAYTDFKKEATEAIQDYAQAIASQKQS